MKRIILALAILLCASPCFAQLVLPSGTGVVQAPVDANGWLSYKLVLTQNVTSFSFVVIPNGTPPPSQAIRTVEFVENAVGGFTVTFASSISSPCTIATGANAVTVCQFSFDASNSQWTGFGGGGAPGGTPSGNASVYVGPNCTGTANCFFADFDTQMAFTVTCNNTSSQITTGANDPPFKASDVTRSIAGTTGVGAVAGCPPQGTISTFIDAHNVTVSVPATQTTTTGVLAWGHNNGSAIQNAFAASLTRGACLYLAEGGAFFDIPLFLDQRSGSAVGTPPCVKGTGNTRLIPLPAFNYSNCITNDACVFKWANAANLNPNYAELEDFEIISPGYNLTGSGANNNIMNLQRVTLKNVWLWNWAGTIGALMTGPNAIFDLNVQGTNCSASGIGGNQTNVLTNSYCLGITTAGVLFTSGSTFGGISNGPSVACGGSWLSSGDVFIAPTSGQDTVRVNGPCNLILDNSQVFGATGNTLGAINCNVSGGNVQLRGNTTIDGGASSGKTIASVAGCTVNNQSGGLAKVITHTPGTFSLSGNSIGQPSEIQSGACVTNAATVTFKYTYSLAPLVSVSVTTSGSTGAQATATNTTTATIHCNGASDAFVATVYPNPI